jgi:hypothetical protein
MSLRPIKIAFIGSDIGTTCLRLFLVRVGGNTIQPLYDPTFVEINFRPAQRTEFFATLCGQQQQPDYVAMWIISQCPPYLAQFYNRRHTVARL